MPLHSTYGLPSVLTPDRGGPLASPMSIHCLRGLSTCRPLRWQWFRQFPGVYQDPQRRSLRFSIWGHRHPTALRLTSARFLPPLLWNAALPTQVYQRRLDALTFGSRPLSALNGLYCSCRPITAGGVKRSTPSLSSHSGMCTRGYGLGVSCMQFLACEPHGNQCIDGFVPAPLDPLDLAQLFLIRATRVTPGILLPHTPLWMNYSGHNFLYKVHPFSFSSAAHLSTCGGC